MKTSLICQINRKGCKNEASYVCHHCGRPLCAGAHCCRWGWDTAFVGLPIAYHCPDCDHLPWLGQMAREVIDGGNWLGEVIAQAIKRIAKWFTKGKDR